PHAAPAHRPRLAPRVAPRLEPAGRERPLVFRREPPAREGAVGLGFTAGEPAEGAARLAGQGNFGAPAGRNAAGESLLGVPENPARARGPAGVGPGAPPPRFPVARAGAQQPAGNERAPRLGETADFGDGETRRTLQRATPAATRRPRLTGRAA